MLIIKSCHVVTEITFVCIKKSEQFQQKKHVLLFVGGCFGSSCTFIFFICCFVSVRSSCGRAVSFCVMLYWLFQHQPAGFWLPPLSSSREPPPTFRARAGGVWCWELRACSAAWLGVLAGCSPPTCAQPLRSTNCATPSVLFIRPPCLALHFGRWLS